MSGFWYKDILEKMDPDELKAIIDHVYAPENREVVMRLSLTCDTREEAAIVAKNIWGLWYDKATGEVKSGKWE